ncbi:carboxymuconolactone decarboxylase family protein [Amycolatopsis oliviviridis]|uniref:Alkyl hydroperoxide reductase AhpD n=2 Tax=Amycolatopsis oliviviridis TaxID=1471590 RepID=A0ABQ3ME00_9PSEU|nr:alkyl hydroperoxide reductase AhpD [Amycolatopsis oliviviridis]
MTMLDPGKGAAFTALGELAKAAEENSSLSSGLRELIKLRCSQLNGCEYCVRLHSAHREEAPELFDNLPEWRTHPAFTERERAALALAETVTLVHTGQVSRSLLEAAMREFGEAGTRELLWIAIVINSYNRLAISTRFA